MVGTGRPASGCAFPARCCKRRWRGGALATALAAVAAPAVSPAQTGTPPGPTLPMVPPLPALPILTPAPRARAAGRPAPTLDALLRASGATWRRDVSRHVALYTEAEAVDDGPSTERAPPRPGRLGPAALLDSLEAAWGHAVALAGAAPADTAPLAVVVTARWDRFPNLLAPSARGLAYVGDGRASPFILLVHHDSARAYTRHEVMHVVASRVWGPPASQWVAEGVATWADGRCQGASVLAVARDQLRAELGLTAAGLSARFALGAGAALGPRHTAYVLAASFIAFVDATAGRDAVRAAWRTGVAGTEGPDDSARTAAWRRYVERAAADEPGLPPGALVQGGCG